MKMTVMSQPDGFPRTASGGSDVQQIIAILRSKPFHEWATFREQVDAAHRRAFDETSALVRSEWDTEELQTQVREALTTAATEIILAMPDPSGGSDQRAHLQAAMHALRAAEELGPQLAAGPAA